MQLRKKGVYKVGENRLNRLDYRKFLTRHGMGSITTEGAKGYESHLL